MSDTSTSTTTKMTVKVPSLWKVTLHNDNYTPMDFVIQILLQIFNKSPDEAISLTMRVHQYGTANVGLFTKEVALTKVKQVKDTAERYRHPLMVTTEEA